MLTFIRTGHVAACSDPITCRCEARRNMVAGTAALSTSVVMAVVGWFSSLAVLSDAPHAFGDSAGYFIAVAVIRFAGSSQLSPRATRRMRRILSALLGLSVILIAHEALDRLWLTDYPISPLLACAAAAYGTIAHGSSWLILRNRLGASGMNDGLVAHAQSDCYHALSVLAISALTAFATRGLAVDLPLKAIDLGFTAVLVAYMSVLTVYVWKGWHLHLSPIRWARALWRLVRRQSAGHAHHHDGCDHTHP